MGHLLPADSIGTPARWLLVFNRKSSSWWTSLIALGRYKHVRAFGWVEEAGVYVFYDVQFGRTNLAVARGAHARRLMLEWTQDADVLSFDARHDQMFRPAPLLCTTAIAHLIGLPAGALRPDALFAQCLRNGAVPIGQASDATGPAGSHACAVDEDCAATAGAGAPN